MQKGAAIIFLAGGLILLGAGSVGAVPVIDGFLGVGEWTGGVLSGSDPNEPLIPDSYDLSGVVMIKELGGSPGDDGLYVLLTTYAVPSLVDADVGPPPASVNIATDYDGDSDFADAGDLFTVHTLFTGFDVFSPTAGLLLDGVAGVHYAMGSVIEYFIPSSVISSVVPLPSSFSGFAIYDNGGDAPDDRMPIKLGGGGPGEEPVIPEPASLWLMSGGLGLLASQYRGRRWQRPCSTQS